MQAVRQVDLPRAKEPKITGGRRPEKSLKTTPSPRYNSLVAPSLSIKSRLLERTRAGETTNHQHKAWGEGGRERGLSLLAVLREARRTCRRMEPLGPCAPSTARSDANLPCAIAQLDDGRIRPVQGARRGERGWACPNPGQWKPLSASCFGSRSQARGQPGRDGLVSRGSEGWAAASRGMIAAQLSLAVERAESSRPRPGQGRSPEPSSIAR